MTFHIDGNLTATEAVRYNEQLQVHPDIEKWAAVFDAVEAKGGVDDLLKSCNKYDEVVSQLLRCIDEVKGDPKKSYTKNQLVNILEELKLAV